MSILDNAITISVLIPSRHRPERLRACLKSLAAQTLLPLEVIVVWQADDLPTRDCAYELQTDLPFLLRILHLPVQGIVPAENLALESAVGTIIALIDDDAEAPPFWLENVSQHFADSRVGAVGGPAINHHLDGTPFDLHSQEPIGLLPWHGFPIGNMYDQPQHWRDRGPIAVDHLVGYNMALKRSAFCRFEDQLKPYWQFFELDACLQVRSNSFKIIFDFSNVVDHFPTNTVYAGGREGDLQIKIFNGAYNLSFIHAKHTPWALAPIRFGLQILVGRTGAPGLAATALSIYRHGRPFQELLILIHTWRAVVSGWHHGLRRRFAGAH